jgi:Raf kinase inhibitor-like YbhB/YbcL family protein
MKLESHSLADHKPVPPRNAMGISSDGGPVPGPNKSPHLAWSDFPAGTQSFAVVCIDPDAPARADDANKADRTIAYDFERADFYHWILVDIPASITSLAEGADSDGLTPRGKAPGKTDHGVRGINSYKEWFGDDPNMGGDYGGYDGPWPPFNDERTHRYVFTVYALGSPSLGLAGKIRGPQALEAIRRNCLAQATLMTTYSLNPKSR